MKVLGLDLGIKRTGLAISDETGSVVRRLSNLVAPNREEAVRQILELIMGEKVDVVIIGLPAGFSDSAINKRAQGLCERLKEALLDLKPSVRVMLWDEALTSKRATENLVNSQVPKGKRKELLDAESAAIMVEDYLIWAKR